MKFVHRLIIIIFADNFFNEMTRVKEIQKNIKKIVFFFNI